MSRYISAQTRQFVADRAGHRCEYCRIREADSFITFQIDHIISRKHGGASHLDNLAWSCYPCNNEKGSDVGTVLLPDKTFVRLFDPRTDIWTAHFELDDAVIHAKTIVGAATIKVLKLNEVDRIIERRAIETGD